MRKFKANKIPARIFFSPNEPKFEESIRNFQGCPTIAISKKGRIFVGWYSGGICEPHMENYNLIVYSDDEGKTWSKPVVVIESSKEDLIHALDIQLWTDKDGKLHVFWVQNNTCVAPSELPKFEKGQPGVIRDGYLFDDFVHAEWEMVCENPDADELVFSKPRCWGNGFLRCKPNYLNNGDILFFNYNQTDSRYGYSISCDNGQTFEYTYGPQKVATYFDECMAYQKQNGEVRAFARCSLGKIAEFSSFDNGRTWTEAKLSDIVSSDTRFYVAKTPSSKILLVKNNHEKQRSHMTVLLSSDDGVTWEHELLIDERDGISYPDVDFYGDKIYLVYDRERSGKDSAKEILFVSFTEEDIIKGKLSAPVQIISKP